MGCDIHMHAEYKINDRWEHLQEVDVDRSYQLFGMLVDGHLRSPHTKGIAPERGIPDDVNPLTKVLLDGSADHTFSYLLGSELNQLTFDEDNPADRYPFLSEGTYQYSIDEELIFSDNFRVVFGFDN